MPEIGRPNSGQANPYRGVKMGPRKNSAANQAGVVGDRLNEVAGNEKNSGVQFVDRKKHNQMGKEEFLKLLTVQLQNQDPYKPVDQKKFASDLAQFASLEQLSGVNKNIEKMSNKGNEASKFHGASFLGKVAITSGTSIDHKAGKSEVIPFSLSRNARNVIVRVVDNKGQTVAQINAENMGKGNNIVSWDGKATDGKLAAGGMYTVEVSAWDETMANFKGDTKSKGVVTGVNFENGETILKIDGKKKVFLRDVDSFLLNEDEIKKPSNKNTQAKAMKTFSDNQDTIQ